MKEELWCKVGGHFWERERRRGRKPIACPDHQISDPSLILTPPSASPPPTQEKPQAKPAKPAAALTEPQRPALDPLASSEPEDDEPVGSTSFNLTPLAELRQRFHIDPESARVLQYVEDQVTGNWPGWRRRGDIDSLRKAYSLRLSQVMRRKQVSNNIKIG